MSRVRTDRLKEFTTGAGVTIDDPRFASGPWVDVMSADFGALRDASTDDKTAIHAARDAAGVGGVVYFPGPGTYLHTGLTANVASQTWLLGPGAVLKLKNSTNTHSLTLSAVGVLVEGGELDGNRANNSTSGYGIAIAAADCMVRRMYIHDTCFSGIASGGESAHRASVLFNRISSVGWHGIYADGNALTNKPHDWLIEGNYVASTGLRGDPDGMQGIMLANGCLRARIIGNHVNLALTQGIEVFNESYYATITGNTIIAPTSLSGGALDCMGISAASGRSTVANNTIFGSVDYAIEVASDSNIVEGNVIQSPAGKGIIISANTNHCLVRGNVIRASGGCSIEQSGATTHIGNSIEGNEILDPPAGGAIFVSGSGASGAMVRGNKIYMSTTGRNAISIAASDTSVEGNSIEYASGIASAAGYGIEVWNDASNCTVTSNKVIGNGKCLKGIYLSDADSVNILVEANQIRGTTEDIINATAPNSQTVIVRHNYGHATSGSGFNLGANVRSFLNYSEGAAAYVKTQGDLPRSKQAIAYAASITPAVQSGEHVFVGALTNNITVNAPTGMIDGDELTFFFLQDGTGGRTVAWNAAFVHSWSDAGNTANRRSSIVFVYDLASTNWHQAGAQRVWA